MNQKSVDLISTDLSFLIDGMPIPCLIIDEDGLIIETNKACDSLKIKGIDLKIKIALNFNADTKDANIFEILKGNFFSDKMDGNGLL